MVCVNSVSVSPRTLNLEVGQYGYPSASVSPSNATCKDVRWSSSNSDVASVNSTSGYVYAKAQGSATITARATDGSGKSDSLTVYVSEPSVVSVTSVTVTPGSVTLYVCDEAYASATVYPSNATNTSVTWNSENTSVARVNSSGKITAIGPGQTKVYATANDGSGKRDYVCVTVDIPVNKIELPEGTHMIVGESLKIDVQIFPSNATDKRIFLEISDPTVATVSSDGTVTALSNGTTSIIAKSVVDESICSESSFLNVLSPDKVSRANQVIQENAQFICNAAGEFGLSPSDVAMVIYAEQCINVDLKDEIIDPLIAPLLDVSLGIGQVKISTAKDIEDSGYMPITYYNDWHGNNYVENREYGIALKLLSAQTNTKYVAAYLKQIIDFWKEAYPSIDTDKGVLATLYNIGIDGSQGPHANPKSTPFGDYAARRYSFLNQLLT